MQKTYLNFFCKLVSYFIFFENIGKTVAYCFYKKKEMKKCIAFFFFYTHGFVRKVLMQGKINFEKKKKDSFLM